MREENSFLSFSLLFLCRTVECMDTVCAMLEVATTDEDKWQLTIFAFSLLRVDDWYVAMAFLEHLKIFISSPPPSFLSV
ncbi:heat repeat-containing protein, partial [Cystoisospora suis]